MRSLPCVANPLVALLGGALIGCGSPSGAASPDCGGPGPSREVTAALRAPAQKTPPRPWPPGATPRARARPGRDGCGRERSTGRCAGIGRIASVGHGLLRGVGRARERRLLPAVGHRLGRADARRDSVLSPGRKRRAGVRLLRRGHGGADHRHGSSPTARRRSPRSAGRAPARLRGLDAGRTCRSS